MTMLGALTHSESMTKACSSWDTIGAVAWTLLRLSDTAWILTAFHCKSHVNTHVSRHSCHNQCVFLCSAVMLPAMPATELQWPNLSAYSRSDTSSTFLNMPDPGMGKSFKWEVCLDEERLSDSVRAAKVMVFYSDPQISSGVIICNTDTLTFLTNLQHQLHLRCTLVSKSGQYQLCCCCYKRKLRG